MKIDLHPHILSRDWPDLDAKYGYSGFVRLDHYLYLLNRASRFIARHAGHNTTRSFVDKRGDVEMNGLSAPFCCNQRPNTVQFLP